MIAIVDYGMGNLRSVQKAVELVGYDALITNKKQDLQNASHIILPGVGAIQQAMTSLINTGIKDELIKEVNDGKPFLGICLGMQMLLDKSYEDGEFECLHLFEGEVIKFKDLGQKIPHIGWNQLNIKKETPLFEGIDDMNFYFVHSYHASGVKPEEVLATTVDAYEFVSAVNRNNAYGVQFHPEKSGDTGLRLLKNFGGLK